LDYFTEFIRQLENWHFLVNRNLKIPLDNTVGNKHILIYLQLYVYETNY
jgi:hypothetical protein